jgi:hypothetical protein
MGMFASNNNVKALTANFQIRDMNGKSLICGNI